MGLFFFHFICLRKHIFLRYKKTVYFCFLLILKSNLFLYAVEKTTEDQEVIQISLNESISKANQVGTIIKQAQYDWEIAKLQYDTSNYSLNYPNFGFALNVMTPSTVYQVPGSEAWDSRHEYNSFERGKFYGDIGIGITEYRLFNSWIDTIDLKIAEITKEKAAINFNLTKKEIKYDVISAYFSLFQVLKNEEILQREVTLSKAILRLVRAKLKISGMENSDVISSEIAVANAERRLLSAKTASYEARFKFLKILGWNTNTIFVLTTEPKYYEISDTLENLKKIFETNNLELQLAQLSVEDSILNEEKEVRQRFPLKVSLSAVNWLHHFGYYKSYNSIETGSIPDGNMSVGVKLSIDIPIIGSEGFANQSLIKEKIINRKKNEEKLRNTFLNGVLEVESVYGQIKRANEEISSSQQNLIKSTDLLTKKMLDSKPNQVFRLELKDLLSETRDLEIDYYDKVIAYNELVIKLSRLVGKDLTEGLTQ